MMCKKCILLSAEDALMSKYPDIPLSEPIFLSSRLSAVNVIATCLSPPPPNERLDIIHPR